MRWRYLSYGCLIILGIFVIITHLPQAASSSSGVRAPAVPVVTETATPLLPPSFTVPVDYVQRVLNRTNSYRRQHGCTDLTLSRILTNTAQAHSQDMALFDFVGHSSHTGLTVAQRIEAAGYTYWLVAENAAWGQRLPEEVVDVWYFESPPNDLHRQNIVDCRLKDIGIGYYYLANDPGAITAHSYWTQDFGAPPQS